MVYGARVLDGEPGEWRIRFRRRLGLAERVEWENLSREVQALPLSADADSIAWYLEPLGNFSTRLVYLHLSRWTAVTCFKKVWRTRVPPKIISFGGLFGVVFPLVRRLLSGMDPRMGYALYAMSLKIATIFSSLALLRG
jgi:hypothetical protein